MSDDEKAGRTTTNMDATQTQALLLKKLQETMEAGFMGVRADIALVSNDVANLRDRVILVEGRQNKIDERLDGNSVRARASSQVDLDQSAALAAEKEAREALAKKVEELEGKTDAQTVILQRIDGVFASPAVRRIGQALAGLVLVAIAAGTVALNQRLASMQTKVETQPAPAVTVVPVFLTPDAGVSDARP